MKRILASSLALLICLPAFALANGQALTPPMGWNSWYKFLGNYNETIIRQTADSMVTNGLVAAGYRYLNLDDCWTQGARDGNGNLLAGTNFPSGMAANAAYIHGDGMKAGIYSGVPSGGYCGAYTLVGHEIQDVNEFVSWGYDFLKCDSANSESNEIWLVQTAISRANQNMLLSLSDGHFETWMPGLGNMWRISGDTSDSWSATMTVLDNMNQSWRYAGPGHWNDADMLQVYVNGGMSDTEYRSHFSMWCITAAPLLLAMDVRSISAAALQIVTNAELIAVDQDAAGVQGHKVAVSAGTGGNLEVWMKPLGTDGTTKAVALLNRSSVAANITAYWTNIDLNPNFSATIRDLWLHGSLGSGTGSFTTNVASHGCVVLQIVGAPIPPSASVADFLATMPQGTYRQYKNISAVTSSGNSIQYPLTLGGTNYPKGFGIVAPSRIDIDLTKMAGQPETFLSDCKIDDAMGSSGSVDFQVWCDGIKQWESGTVTGSSGVTNANVNVAGVSLLSLIVTNLSGVPSQNDCADWGDPRILRWRKPSLRAHQ
ncbi:MAG TPA: NPCBM/NEW2 domain-containing protein [Verrucomicrobiae bacterium]|nr:NPCBM/NEW2 domain-containing protein [Verrucomicrobiae bacterium]